MDYQEWLKDPWKVSCSEFCPYIDKPGLGCACCEKLGHSKEDTFNCYECSDFMKFEKPLKSDRYLCCGTSPVGICTVDMGLICYPVQEYCVGRKLKKVKSGDEVQVVRYKEN